MRDKPSRMRFMGLLLPFLFLFSASAVSNGNLLTCNVDMAIGAGTPVMKWVKAPVSSAMYTINAPSGSYVPGELIPITINVLDLDYIYIGLLLVAVNNGTNVGQWYVMDGDDFFLPATCKFKAVVHSNADLKPINQTFYWKAPAGTGPVTFRALIKQGEQNHGNFYKPADLTLTESTAAPAAQTVWKGEPGDSCNEVCGKKNMACDDAGTLGLNTPSILQSQVSKYYPCRAPYARACVPPGTGANAYCFAYGCSGGRSFTGSVCSHRSSDPVMNQRFCKCKAGAAVRDPTKPASDVNMTIGLRLADPLQLDTELILNSLEIDLDGNVTIDITGPQDRWFAIGWDASYMSGTYATVVSLNDPTVGIPQNYDVISYKGYVDSDQGWYDIKCQQALVDFCRNVGSTRFFSCALSNTTDEYTLTYNVSNPNTYLANKSSRVPCKGGKIAPFRPMTVAEYILGDSPRNATKIPSSTTIERSGVVGGRFNIAFTRAIDGDIRDFPTKKSMNLIWSIGVTQYFGVSSNAFNKHSKRSETPTIINLVPVYGTCPPPEVMLSPAFNRLPSMWVLPALAALGTKNWLCGALLAVLLRPVSAHNWMNTPSRAQISAVSIPCQERVDPAPHLQVVPGQKFQMEWSTGHGDTSTVFTYFVLVSEDDYDKLNFLTDAMLDEYLAKAPSYLTGDEWAKRHLSPWKNYYAGCSGCNNGTQFAGTFAAVLDSTNPKYIPRNPIAVRKSRLWYDPNVTQFWDPASQLADDLRAEYKSEKYPWMLSVHKFRIAAHWPEEYDIATFAFPLGLPAGNYIAHFNWGGYRDCTDVHVMVGGGDVDYPWGRIGPNVTSSFTRLDHCEFTFVRNPLAGIGCQKMIAGNASQCMANCLKDDWCVAIQGVRKTNPAGTMPYTPNYPYKQYTYNTSSDGKFPPPEFGPCDSRTIQKRRTCPDISTTCGDAAMSTMNDSDYMCYGFYPYRDQDFQTVEDYVISTDPEDPGFYSTCWVRLAPGGFLPYPEPKKPQPVWRVGDRCLSCDWLKNTYSKLASNIAPDWTQAFTSDCQDCDISDVTCDTNLEYIEGGTAGNCTGSLATGQTCDAKCDRGFKLFGPSRVCQGGLLDGANQMCVFEGCDGN